MERIDRLGWTAGLVFVSYGLRIGLRTNAPTALERAVERLPPGWKYARGAGVRQIFSLWVGGPGKRPGVRHYHLLYRNEARATRTLDLEDALHMLQQEVALYVAERASRRVFIHAGVVSWKGRALLIPGRSHSGKTTMVMALMRAGAHVYSDEYAVLDPQGRVHPYPRPLSVRLPEGRPDRPDRIPLRDGSRPPLEVAMVALCTYAAAARWRPRRLSPGDAALGLLANTVSARYRPAAAMKVLERVTARAVTFRGKRGEAEEAAQALLKLMDAGTEAPP